jgi:hypothetical protein
MAENTQLPASAKKAGSEPLDITVYETSLVPVLWLVVPFILVIAYGIYDSF